jgi:hypothetical protein
MMTASTTASKSLTTKPNNPTRRSTITVSFMLSLPARSIASQDAKRSAIVASPS